MASSSTLLTKRTIGVSSTSVSLGPAALGSSPSEMSKSSKLSSPAKASMDADVRSSARSMALRSLSSSASTGSVLRPVLNLISSNAGRLVGSDKATYNLLPRLNKGRALCLRISVSFTRSTVSCSSWIVCKSNSGMPNSRDAVTAMISLFIILFSTR